jgi:hypothetical protein
MSVASGCGCWFVSLRVLHHLMRNPKHVGATHTYLTTGWSCLISSICAGELHAANNTTLAEIVQQIHPPIHQSVHPSIHPSIHPSKAWIGLDWIGLDWIGLDCNILSRNSAGAEVVLPRRLRVPPLPSTLCLLPNKPASFRKFIVLAEGQQPTNNDDDNNYHKTKQPTTMTRKQGRRTK